MSNHKNEADRYEQKWERACAKDSPLVKGVKELRQSYLVPLRYGASVALADHTAATDSFIERHSAAMDICEHPSVRISLLTLIPQSTCLPGHQVDVRLVTTG